MNHKGTAGMLAVTPEVNLRIPLYAGDGALKQETHPGFETLGRRHKKSKQGYQWPHKTGLMSSKHLKIR